MKLIGSWLQSRKSTAKTPIPYIDTRLHTLLGNVIIFHILQIFFLAHI